MPASGLNVPLDSAYTPLVACVFVSNLMLGTGALTMPAAFSDAGWILSSLVVFLIGLMSYVTVTFIIEGMSIANAFLKSDRFVQINTQLHSRLSSESHSNGGPVEPVHESAPLIQTNPLRVDLDLQSSESSDDSSNTSTSSLFDITEKVELGHMAAMFFSPSGLNLFYLCIALYLYGDLAIYAAAISKSLRDMICTYDDCSKASLDDSDVCWPSIDATFDRSAVYRILIVAVAIVLGPFTFFNVQKTKYLQVFTSMLRWLSFSSMIVLSFVAIGEGRSQGRPPKVSVYGIPSLFGVCVYSFMCHHSLPSLITPIHDKRRLHLHVGLVYLLILTIYYLLSFTGIFTFPLIEDVYTLNFQKERCSANETHTVIVPEVPFFEYFLPLFPVFTLATSFPIIAITLTNNLRALLFSRLFNTSRLSIRMRFLINQVCFPLVALIPPILISLTTQNLEILVGLVGSYAGAGIQYLIPAMLVHQARQKLTQIDCSTSPMAQYLETSGSSRLVRQRFQSPFKHRFWIHFVLGWAAVCIILVTINHISNLTQ